MDNGNYGNRSDDDEWEKSCNDRMGGLHNSITLYIGAAALKDWKTDRQTERAKKGTSECISIFMYF